MLREKARGGERQVLMTETLGPARPEALTPSGLSMKGHADRRRESASRKTLTEELPPQSPR